MKPGPKLQLSESPHLQTAVLILGGELSRQVFEADFQKVGASPVLGEEAFFPEGLLPPGESGAQAQLESLLDAFRALARESGARSFWVFPGLSPWAGRAELILQADKRGMATLGPGAQVAQQCSDRLSLLMRAESLGIPQLVLHNEPLQTIREIERWVLSKGGNRPFPLVLKSVRGGGAGASVLVLHCMEDLEDKVPLWLDRLRVCFGEALIFIERYLEGSRHLAVPFIRFASGRIVTLPPLDVSLQYRHRKLVVSSTQKDGVREEAFSTYSHRILESLNYVGWGVMEFLCDGESCALVEVIPRLTSEVLLLERFCAIPYAQWALLATQGREPTAARVEKLLERIEARRADTYLGMVRIYAEDPVLQLPQPGRVREAESDWESELATVQRQDGPRVLWNIRAGGEVSIFSDGLLALVDAEAPSREELAQRLQDGLGGIWISGALQTNERFLKEVLQHPWVAAGMIHAGFLDEEFVPRVKPNRAWLQAFVVACQPLVEDTVLRWIVGDQWVPVTALGSAEVEWVQAPERESGWGLRGVLKMEGSELRVSVVELSPLRWQVRLGDWFLVVKAFVRQEQKALKAEDKRDELILRALVSGRVRALLFQPGSFVRAHDPLLTLESLGQVVPHALPLDVRVREWKIKSEQVVTAGQELAVFERG